ncbi:MAG: class I SAM-dependent methyltransferase, partial [Chloroflexota bacterium]|nr:class I SAM-dependent methyltransferase [Chloroflexota bacterium]
FSSIGYVKTRSHLQQAIHTMSEHLVSGGLLMIEPWFTPDTFHPGYISAVFVDQPDLKIARMNVTTVEGTVSMLDFNYLVASIDGVDYFRERHELGLFTHQEYIAALEEQGLEVTHLADGLMGRGLYVGIKPTG